MSHSCRDDMTGFDELLRLPADHPDRVEVENCPRCGSRLLEYQTFLLANDVTGADAAAAQRRLTTFIASEAARALPSRSESENSARGRWRFPTFRWAVPAAAVLIVAAIGLWRLQPGGDQAPEVRAVGEASRIVLLPAQSVDGSLEIRWEPVATADSYQVRLLGRDFAEISRIGPLEATSVRVDSTAAVYYQVVGLAGGDEIAVSPLRHLPAQPSE